MWRPAYKQRCLNCKKNMVLIKYPKQRAICSECQTKSISTPITDPKFKKLFNIDPELYQQSSFLRDIRYQYGRFENLSERQISTFARVVKEMTDKAKAASDPSSPKLAKPAGPFPVEQFADSKKMKVDRAKRRSRNPMS